jgi:hypothetical protein
MINGLDPVETGSDLNVLLRLKLSRAVPTRFAKARLPATILYCNGG